MDTSIWRPILYLIGIMAFAGVNAAWLGWWNDRLDQMQVPAGMSQRELFRATWSGGKLTPETALMAAAEAVIFSTDYQKAPAKAVEAFNAGRQYPRMRQWELPFALAQGPIVESNSRYAAFAVA